jgi:hypothetical protein
VLIPDFHEGWVKVGMKILAWLNGLGQEKKLWRPFSGNGLSDMKEEG